MPEPPELDGLLDVDDAKELSKAQRRDELPAMIDDETLHRFVVVGTNDEIGDRLLERYAAVVTDVAFSVAVADDEDREMLRRLAAVVQGADDTEARAEIVGDEAQRRSTVEVGGVSGVR